jgi:hypothetical protein
MTIKISQLGNLTVFTENTLFPVVDTANAYITVKSSGSTLLTYIAGNITTLSQNITGSGNITVANSYVNAAYFTGNGSALTGMNQYSNVQVATYLPSYSGAVQASNIYTSLATITSNVGIALNVAGDANIGGNITCTVMSATAVATDFYNEKINYVMVNAAPAGYNLSNTVTNNILLIFASNPTATINMPVNPIDGDVVRISANANVVLAVGTVVLAVGTGNVQPSFAGANILVNPLQYIYSNTYATWFSI